MDQKKYIKFYNKTEITNEEYQYYQNVLKAYDESYDDLDDKALIPAMIEEAISRRLEGYDDLYDDVDKVIKGDVLTNVKPMFAITTGNYDALTIMNNKAAIFDVRSINVELKSKTAFNTLDYLNDGTGEFVSILSDIINESYLPDPKYGSTFSDAIKYSRGYPMAVTLIGWDDNATLGNDTNVKGDITCENVPLKSFWWDPSVNNLDDCGFCMVAKILPYWRIDKFLKDINGRRDLFTAFYVAANAQVVSNEGDSDIRPNSVLVNNGSVELMTFYRKNIEKDNIDVFHVVGRRYIVGKQTYDIPYLPFAILKEQDAPNSFTGVSSVMNAMPLIKQKFFIDQVCNNIALLMKNPIYVVSAQSGIDGSELISWDTQDTGKALATNDVPGNSVAMVASPQISNDILSWRDRIVNDINNTIGSSDIANGTDLTSKLSGAAVNNAVNQATIKENTSVVELERYLTRFVRVMLAFMKTKLSQLPATKQLVFRARNTNPNTISEETNTFVLSPKEFENIDYDVFIDAEMLRTSRQLQKQQDLLTVYQLDAQFSNGKPTSVTLADLVKSLKLPNKQQILKRIQNQTDERQLQQALLLVQGINALQMMPETQGLQVEEATAQIVQMLKQPEGEAQVQQLIQVAQQYQQQMQQQDVMNQLQGGLPQDLQSDEDMTQEDIAAYNQMMQEGGQF